MSADLLQFAQGNRCRGSFFGGDGLGISEEEVHHHLVIILAEELIDADLVIGGHEILQSRQGNAIGGLPIPLAVRNMTVGTKDISTFLISDKTRLDKLSIFVKN